MNVHAPPVSRNIDDYSPADRALLTELAAEAGTTPADLLAAIDLANEAMRITQTKTPAEAERKIVAMKRAAWPVRRLRCWRASPRLAPRRSVARARSSRRVARTVARVAAAVSSAGDSDCPPEPPPPVALQHTPNNRGAS
jgi:hypothetical protein